MTSRRWLALSVGCTASAVGVLAVSGASATTDVIGLSLAGAACLWVGLQRPALQLSRRWVLGVAVLLRLAALPLAPSLSADGYRYLWDGKVWAVLGESPYAFPPSARPNLDPDLLARLNSSEYVSVYPPMSQAFFSTAASWTGGSPEGQWIVLKCLLVAGELVGVFALSRYMRPSALALYAWHPLSVIEGAGQGHSELLLVGTLGVLFLLWNRRPRWMATVLMAAAAVKSWPLALAPLVAGRSGWQAMGAAATGAVLLSMPWWLGADWAGVLDSYTLYVGVFDFYSAPYRILKGALWGGLGGTSGEWAARGLGMLWLSLVAVLWMGSASARPSRQSLLIALIAYGVLSPVQHPWHWLPLLAVVPLLHMQLPLYTLISFSIATYLYYGASAPAYEVALWVGWGSALGLVLYCRRAQLLAGLLRRRARSKWARLRTACPPLRPGGRLLDVGCGEGFVGDRAAEDSGLAVTLADVIDLAQSRRPLQALSPRSLPFGDARFDTVVLSYVLHHAEDPVSVLSESVRVSRGPVLVLETIATHRVYTPLLQILDSVANHIRGGWEIDALPPHIRPVDEWRRLAQEAGLHLEVVRAWGLVHPQALFLVTDSTSSAVASA